VALLIAALTLGAAEVVHARDRRVLGGQPGLAGAAPRALVTLGSAAAFALEVPVQ